MTQYFNHITQIFVLALLPISLLLSNGGFLAAQHADSKDPDGLIEPVIFTFEDESLVIGSNKEIFLKVDAGEHKVAAVSLEIRFPANLLDIEGCGELIDFQGVCNNLSNGQIKLSAVNTSGKSGEFNFVKLNMIPIAAGEGFIQIFDIELVSDEEGNILEWEKNEGNIQILPPTTQTPEPPNQTDKLIYLPFVKK